MTSLWLVGATAGAWALLHYENASTPAGDAPLLWPSKSRIHLAAGNSTLLMFMHPHCPCSRASVGELNRLLVQCKETVATHVLFVQPDGEPNDWAQTTLRKSVEAIPGVDVQLDRRGEEASRFGAESSGYVVLYDRQGHLLFSGGITAGRGHAGDNAGENAIIALANGHNISLKHTDVFGCSLLDRCENKTNEVRL